MNTRMEKVAQDVALTALRIVTHVAQPTPQLEKIKEDFQARWPVPDSNRPMNDAISAVAQALSSCTGQDADTWKTTLAQTWQPAVEEVVEAYFKTARHSFQKGEPSRTPLTDVRATLGHIAATRDWPHGTHDDLYSIAAALGSRTEWPENLRSLTRPTTSSHRNEPGRACQNSTRLTPHMGPNNIESNRPTGAKT